MEIGADKKKASVQYLPISIFILLAISLYFPQVFPTSPLISIRSQISSILVSTTLLAVISFNKRAFAQISFSKIIAAFIFPAFLLLHGALYGNVGLAFFGNSDRSLGIMTYITCGCFFLLGCLIRSNFPEGFVKVVFLLTSLQMVSLATSYFGIANDRRLGSFLNSNPNGVFCGILYVLVLVWIAESNKKSRFIPLTIISLLCILTLLWIEAKQAYVGLIVTLLAYGIFKAFKVKLKISNLFLITFMTTLLTFIIYIYLAKTPSESKSNINSFDERLDI